MGWLDCTSRAGRQVTAGLALGQTIIVHPGDAVADGVKVVPR
jgi:hypothetical protein